jgi:hypothetical protein
MAGSSKMVRLVTRIDAASGRGFSRCSSHFAESILVVGTVVLEGAEPRFEAHALARRARLDRVASSSGGNSAGSSGLAQKTYTCWETPRRSLTIAKGSAPGSPTPTAE